MRSLLFFCEMMALLPIACVRPFVGVLGFAFISFANLHRLAWGFTGSVPWAYLTAIATVIGCIGAQEPKRSPFNPTTLLILLFIVLFSLSSLVALAPMDLVAAKWEANAKAFGFLVLIAAMLSDKFRIHALLWVMVISLGYYGVKGGGFTILKAGGARIFGPPATTIADNNHLAAGLLVTLPVMNYLRMQSAHRIIRIALLFGMILTLFAVVGSYSRGALLGLGAVSFVLWLRSPNKLVTGIVVVVMVAAAIHFMPQAWMDRMSTLQEYERDASAQTRFEIWQAAWAMGVARPLTGAGFMGPYVQDVVSAFAPGTDARAVHSIWLEPIGELGFPAFFVWLSITLVGIWNTIQILRESRGIADLQWARDLARMTQVSIVAYLVAGTFLSLSYWDFYFTLLVVLAATRILVAIRVGEIAEANRSVAPWRARLRPRRLSEPTDAPARSI